MMRRSIVIAIALIAAGCQSPAPLRMGLSAQLADATPTPNMWQRTAIAEEQARWAACPAVTHGCFAQPPTCVVSVCFCPRVCELAGFSRQWRYPAWSRGGAQDCRCE